MEKAKVRDSNFELLRIVAIIMVIMSHYNFFGGNFNNTSVTFNFILTKIFSLGCVANHIFVILTGYYMIKSKVNYKKIIALILEMLFYSLSIMIVTCILGISHFSVGNLVKSLFSIFWGNWFLIYYILLYLLIPFLNSFIEKIDRKQLKNLIVLLLIIFIIIPTFTNNAWGYTGHDYFLLDYLIGAYIRLFPIKLFESNKFNIKMLCLSFGLLVLSVLMFMFIGDLFNISMLIQKSSYFVVNNYSVLVLMCSFFMFLVFKNMKIKSNKLINSIAGSVLGIYLIHMNSNLFPWLWVKFWSNLNYFNTYWFIPHQILKISLVFICCLLIDKIRIFLFGKLERKISEIIFDFIVKWKINIIKIIKKIFYRRY